MSRCPFRRCDAPDDCDYCERLAEQRAEGRRASAAECDARAEREAGGRDE